MRSRVSRRVLCARKAGSPCLHNGPRLTAQSAPWNPNVPGHQKPLIHTMIHTRPSSRSVPGFPLVFLTAPVRICMRLLGPGRDAQPLVQGLERLLDPAGQRLDGRHLRDEACEPAPAVVQHTSTVPPPELKRHASFVVLDDSKKTALAGWWWWWHWWTMDNGQGFARRPKTGQPPRACQRLGR